MDGHSFHPVIPSIPSSRSSSVPHHNRRSGPGPSSCTIPSGDRMNRITKAALVLAVLWAAPAAAQGQGRGNRGQPGHEDQSKVTVDIALGAGRGVLVAKGYEVVRVEVEGDRRVVY